MATFWVAFLLETNETRETMNSVVALIPHPSNSNLFLGVSRKTDQNDMGLPGGKADGHPKETFRDAMARELHEETGLNITSMKPLIKVSYGNQKTVWSFLVTTKEDKDLALKPLEEIVNTKEAGRVAWVTREELLAGSFGDYNRQLFTYLDF